MGDSILGSVKIYASNQITIPYRVRKRYNVKPGDYMVFEEKEGKLFIYFEGEVE